MSQWRVRFDDYAARWREAVPAPARAFSYGSVLEDGGPFPLLAAHSPGKRSAIITAGFHGDEKAGPLTLLDHVAEIVAYAVERDVALHIYPCINPSGFEAHTRYNLSGERPNNDFLRYETEPDSWRGELRPGQSFLGSSVLDPQVANRWHPYVRGTANPSRSKKFRTSAT